MKTETPAAGQAAGAAAVDQFWQKQFIASPAPLQSHVMDAVGARQRADNTACQFLRLILPEQGVYIATLNRGESKWNEFAQSIEQLWDIIRRADSNGLTAYHACASFKEARHNPKGTPSSKRQFGRTKRNVLGAKAFWADVDAGEAKPYGDWKAAAAAVAAFCRATGVPVPLCVLSGFGLHVYWPLDRMLDPETWKRYAIGLKALCVRHGLRADPSRTADISSVLRTPGTHHRKRGDRLVQCGPLVGPYALEQFQTLLSENTEKPSKAYRRSPFQLGPIPPHLANRRSRRLVDVMLRPLAKREPSNSVLIARRCEQVRALRDSRGNLPEPLWYSSLGVLAFAGDGERFAHEWSGGDPRYTEHETQDRLDRARQLTGPTTCARFHDLEREVCRRCRWWGKIRSPIVLGQRRSVRRRR
jgi:hypothetical protein